MEQYINKILNADCLDILRQLPDKCVDLVLTDPPYNASNSKIKNEAKSYKAVNEDWDKGYTPSVEYAVWFVKGSPYAFNKKFAGKDIIATSICGGNERENHPTQKPLELWNKLLLVHSNENDLVLDCFSGPGTTAVACHNLKRRFICVEKDPEYWKASCERLEQAQRQQMLF